MHPAHLLPFIQTRTKTKLVFNNYHFSDADFS